MGNPANDFFWGVLFVILFVYCLCSTLSPRKRRGRDLADLGGWMAGFFWWLDGMVARWLDGRLVWWQVGLVVGRVVGCVAGWLVGLMAGWTDGWMFGWFGGWLPHWMCGWING